MVEIVPPSEENNDKVDFPTLVSKTASGIALLALQRTLDEGGTIEIPSLGIVIDKKGSGNLVELDDSQFTVE
jgi:hypothetical protein